MTAADEPAGRRRCPADPELQAIIALCAEPMSVAEISARPTMHLGVTRVLVGDLRAAGTWTSTSRGRHPSTPTSSCE